MSTRIGINGFGRIGRQTLKAILERHPEALEVVAINDLAPTATNAHLFRYDSTYGRYDGVVTSGEGTITVDGHEIKAFSERDPAALPWGDLAVDIVIESTGIFTDADQGAGAPRRRSQEGHHQRARQERGRDARARASTRIATTRRSTTS